MSHVGYCILRPEISALFIHQTWKCKLMKICNSALLTVLICAVLAGCQTSNTQPEKRIASNSKELSEMERAIEKYKYYKHRKAFATVIGKNGAWSYGYNRGSATRELAVKML